MRKYDWRLFAAALPALALFASIATTGQAAETDAAAWASHRDSVRSDASLAAYYTFEGLAEGATTVTDLARGDGALTYAPVAKAGEERQRLQIVAGRWPGKPAVQLDCGALAGPAPELARQFTVSAVVRIDGLGGLRGNNGATNGTLLAIGNGYWEGMRLTTHYPGKTIGFELGRPQPSHAASIGTLPLGDKVWRHVVAVWNGPQMQLFVDGALVASGPFDAPFTASPDQRALRIGYAGAGLGSVVVDVDEVAIYRRALAPEEVLRHAYAPSVLPPAAAARFLAANEALLADRADEAAAGFTAMGSDASLPDNFRAAARLRQAAALLKARRPGPAGRVVAELLAMPSSTAQNDAEALAVRLLRESPGALPVSTLRRVLELPGVTAREQTAVHLTMADESMAMGRFAQARAFYEKVLAATEASPLVRGVAQLGVVRSHLRQNDLPTAEAACAQLPKMEGIPPHFALEARQQIDEAKRVAAGLPARDPAATRTRIAPLPSPAITLHVATDGADANPGTADRPLATLEGARDLLRSLKAAGKLNGPAEVVVRGGTYRVTQTFKLSAADSGTAEAPITYRAASGEKPVFSGGVQLTGFRPVDDAAVLARLPEESRGKVFGVDLASHGISKFEPLKLGGFASGLGFQTFPMMELFFDGRALPLSRWPNEGFVQVADAPTPEPGARSGAGMKTGWFRYDGDRPERWQQEKDILLYGYWWHSWADSYERVTSIDVAEKKIQLAEPFHGYGYRKGQPFCAVNLLAEIDRPGEWYLDRSSGTLYVYPPSDPNKALIQLSTGAFPFVVVDGASHVGFRQLTWELGAADAIMVKNASHIDLLGCTLQRFAGNGIEFQGGTNNRIMACDIHSMGRGGTIIGGGDRKTLTPGGHVVENCHIHDLSRIDHTYTPAVKMTGVGHRVAHNLMHDIDSSAINMTGNDHVIERNEVCRVVRESDDQGGLDSFGNATYRGNVIRHNFWHHIGNWSGEGEVPHCGQAGVRLDDAISGVLIYGNVFYRCSAGQMGFGGVQIHGGKDNLIDGNLFVDCSAAISFSPWGQQRWQTFTAKSLDASDVDRTLYLARYPELARLADDHDVNAVSRNLVYDCGEFLRRDRGQTQAVGNHVTDENPGFIDAGAGDIRMNPRLPAFERAGQATIPLDEIGPYRDEFRRERPSP